MMAALGCRSLCLDGGGANERNCQFCLCQLHPMSLRRKSSNAKKNPLKGFKFNYSCHQSNKQSIQRTTDSLSECLFSHVILKLV